MNRRSFLKWSGFGLVAATLGGLCMREAQAGNRYYSGPLSDHFDGKVFFNPGGEEPRGFTDLLRWQFGGGKIDWPKAVAAADFVTTNPEPRIEGSRLVVTMVGHATLLIQTAGLNILTDPVWWFYLFWLPKYLVEQRGFTMVEMGMLAWIPYLSADLGALIKQENKILVAAPFFKV